MIYLNANILIYDNEIQINNITQLKEFSESIFNIEINNNLYEIKGNKLKVVALDKFRIAIRNIELKDDFDNQKVIIPGKSLNEISKILNGGLEDVFSIEYDENNVKMEHYSESPSIEEILDMSIRDVKKATLYSAKTIEIGTKGVKFVCQDKLEVNAVYDFVLSVGDEFGNIEFSGLINSNDEVFPEEYEMSYTKISGDDRQNILRFIYSV